MNRIDRGNITRGAILALEDFDSMVGGFAAGNIFRVGPFLSQAHEKMCKMQ